MLGFVKYFWRDAIARIKKEDKQTLICRLSSFDTTGLGLSPLPGRTLVTYAGSLVGRDFRAISQAAPIVLQGLMPPENLDVWLSLSVIVSLVWEPEIEDIDSYLVSILILHSQSRYSNKTRPSYGLQLITFLIVHAT